MKYVCDLCGYIYDPEEGDPDNGVAAGTEIRGSSGRLDMSPLRGR